MNRSRSIAGSPISHAPTFNPDPSAGAGRGAGRLAIPVVMFGLRVVLAQQVDAVIVAVGRAHDRMDVKTRGFGIGQEDPRMVVEFDEDDRALDPVVEGARLSGAADPAKMRLGEMPLDLVDARLQGSCRKRFDKAFDQIQQIAFLPARQRVAGQALERHDPVVLVRAAQMEMVGEVPSAGRVVLALHRVRDDRPAPHGGREGAHQGETLVLLVLEQADPRMRPGVGVGRLRPHEAGREHHPVAEDKAVET